MHMCWVAPKSMNQELALTCETKLVLINTSLVFFLYLSFFFVILAPVGSLLEVESPAVGFRVIAAVTRLGLV